SGIYYKPGSLKAKLCREGNRRMVEFCQLHGIRYEECGKVIVATTETELGRLENLYQRGLANELVVKKLNKSQVREIEPHVNCLAGIQVPSTGIADYAGVSRKLAELLAAAGCELRLGTKVQALHTNCRGMVVETSKGAIAACWLVNCAGLQC